MSQPIAPARRPDRRRRPAMGGLVLSALLLPALPALATTYSVGSGAGCSHATLLAALDAAASDASPGPHRIKVDAGTRFVNNYEIIDPAQDLIIEGGFTACTDAAPAAGQRSTLDAGDVAGSRVLRIANATGNPRRSVRLRRLTLTGGLNPSGQLGWGGALHAQGRLTLILEDTHVDANTAVNGGGIAVFNLTTNPDLYTRLLVTEGSRVCQNAATGPGSNGNGGGIHALGGTEIRFWDGSVCTNQARRHGGGLFMGSSNDGLVLDPVGQEVVDFTGNSAGGAGFSDSLGFGGAIYALRAGVSYGTSTTPPTLRSARFAGNRANFGGALYLEGSASSADPFTTAELRNVTMSDNQALGRGGAVFLRNAVDLRLVKAGAGACTLFGQPWPCVDLFDNVAGNQTFSSAFGGGGFAFLEQGTGAPRPALRVAGAMFDNNADPNGTTAVVDARGESSVRIVRSVFRGNSAGGSASFRTLVEARTSFLFAYNTVLDNPVAQLLIVNGAGNTVTATGSILHSPGAGLVSGGGAMVHDQCLVAHTDAGVPPGVKVVASPRLGAGFVPRPQSAAIDTCDFGLGDSFWPTGLDGYGQPAPVDVASIPDQPWGPWDLGAIEQRDVMFYGGFGFRPGH